jgi:UDP-2,3-diacylglucosamine pyrophosphatase LpxH
MTFAFDLISDLHVETWEKFDWTGQATSPVCVVAGDISRDIDLTVETLTHLGKCYQAVFYIDGNDEHRYQLAKLDQNYHTMSRKLASIQNVVFLREHVVVINGVAIVGTNGWWSYDFDLNIDVDQTRAWFQDAYQINTVAVDNVASAAYNDAAYLINSVKKLQTHPDVRSIVIVSHTVPAPWLVNHDIGLINTWRFNTTGNPHLELVLDEDSEHKIQAWCFGHYHQPVDRIANGIRYTNNCRGRGDTEWCQRPYFPKRIEIA